jgi:hypothetical protein
MEPRTSSGIPVFLPMVARCTMSTLSPSWKLCRPAIARSVVGVSMYSANAKPCQLAYGTFGHGKARHTLDPPPFAVPSLTKLKVLSSPKLLSNSMTCSSLRYVGRPPMKSLFGVSATLVPTIPGNEPPSSGSMPMKSFGRRTRSGVPSHTTPSSAMAAVASSAVLNWSRQLSPYTGTNSAYLKESKCLLGIDGCFSDW